jgi:hypothetical protein
MNDERKIEETEKAPTTTSPEGEEQRTDGANPEFMVTVRKLELPVRPRGVLADG